MDIETSRDIIANLIKLKDINRDDIVDILLTYIVNGYDLEHLTKNILAYNTREVIRGL